jgi:hypothetical protein
MEAEPLSAEFDGERDGTEPLTWGQRSIWDTARRLAPADHFLNVRRVLSLSERAAMRPPAAVAAIGALVGRHEAVRTRVRLIGGEPHQVVGGSGRIPVVVVPVTAAVTPAAAAGPPATIGPPAVAPAAAAVGPPTIGPTAAAGASAAAAAGRAAGADRLDDVALALRDRLAERAFDYAEEWPLRVGLVTLDGVVRRVALVISHVSVDGHATELLLRDLRLLLLRGALPPPAARRQPLDLARAERSLGDLNARALRHWTAGYDRLPATTMLTRVGAAHEPRYQRLLLTSTALDQAARVLAHRHTVSTATVYLAATAAVLRDWTGHRVCGLETLVHNRFQRGHADVVGTLVQTGLFVVDVADAPPLDALVPRVFRAALDSYRNAYYFPPDRDRIAERYREPGDPFNPYGCFNDVRVAPETTRPEPPSAASVFTPQPAPATMHCRLCVEIHDAPQGVGVLLTADTAYLPPDDMRRFLAALESVAVTAAPS